MGNISGVQSDLLTPKQKQMQPDVQYWPNGQLMITAANMAAITIVNTGKMGKMGKNNMSKKKPVRKKIKQRPQPKTVDQEIVTNAIDLSYPDILGNDKSKAYYDCYMISCSAMSAIFHTGDKYQLAHICEQMVVRDNLWIEAREQPIIHEHNGNTGILQSKPNPALSEYHKLHKLITVSLKDFGLSPVSRVDMYAKMATVKSDDIIDEKTAEAIKDDKMQTGIFKVS